MNKEQVDIFLVIYSKGGKVKKGDCKYIMTCRGKSIEKRETYADTTGHRLALQCFVASLKRMRKASILTVHTDCYYLINGYQRLLQYKSAGWTRDGNKELKNADLWEELDGLLSEHAVRFKAEYMKLYE